MSTISENLQTIKNSTDDIRQAILNKGGNITGDITTWAEAINGISGGGTEYNIDYGQTENNKEIYNFLTGLLSTITFDGKPITAFSINSNSVNFFRNNIAYYINGTGYSGSAGSGGSD